MLANASYRIVEGRPIHTRAVEPCRYRHCSRRVLTIIIICTATRLRRQIFGDSGADGLVLQTCRPPSKATSVASFSA
jgi:hypothetical protein